MSGYEKGFQVKEAQGAPVVPVAGEDDKELFESRLPDILAAMQDANYQPSEVLKLIAIEQANVVNQMSIKTTGWGMGGQGKRLEVKMKALTELRKTVQEAEELSKKDILNFDGPKFEHVFGVLCDWTFAAMTANGLTEEQANNVMKTFRDKVSTEEVDLRKSTEKIDSN